MIPLFSFIWLLLPSYFLLNPCVQVPIRHLESQTCKLIVLMRNYSPSSHETGLQIWTLQGHFPFFSLSIYYSYLITRLRLVESHRLPAHSDVANTLESDFLRFFASARSGAHPVGLLKSSSR